MAKTKKIQSVSEGRIYIQATFNNTIITITSSTGAVLSWSTAGSSGFKGSKKATPYAAQIAMTNALEKVAKYNLRSAEVFVSGVGNGRDAALRALTQSNLEVNQIKDITPIPHNGARAKKPRRV